MAASKGDLLEHFKHLQKALDRAGCEAILSVANFSLLIRRGAEDRVLYPQFLAVSAGVKQYTQTFGMNARQFIGWLPYYNKRWEIATSKLSFKAYAKAHDIRTPDYSADPDADLRDVIVKRSISSFGAWIRGPFKSSSATTLNLDSGEYYERLIRGKIIKAWFWNGIPVCLEQDTMPTLIGDGTSTIAALARKRLRGQKRRLSDPARQTALEKMVIDKVGQMATYQGHQLDTVMPTRQPLLADFRYASELALPSYRQIVNLRSRLPSEFGPQLAAVGKALWEGIPVDARQDTLFTVDAILDADNRVWSLEMNSNPFVHPLAYPHIVAAMFPLAEPIPTAGVMH
jgi:hypothetical protein